MTCLPALLLVALSGDPCPDANGSPNPCRMVTGYAAPTDPRETGTGYAVIRGVSDGEEFEVHLWSHAEVYHEDDPDVPLPAAAAHGRWVRTCVEHFGPRRHVIVGGMPPRDFAMAVASVMPAAPGRAMTRLEALVWWGLSSDRYATRQAAHDCLLRAGAAAIGPCVGGLGSRDAEVRHRCRLILAEIRDGSMELEAGK